MTQPEDLTAFLADVRMQAEDHHLVPGADALRLVAALEEVLELAGKLEPQAPAASALEEDRMWIRQECAGMIREAISRALLGETDG